VALIVFVYNVRPLRRATDIRLPRDWDSCNSSLRICQ